MNKNTVIVLSIVLGVFALIAITAILKFRKGVRVKVTGPLKTGLDVDASNPPLTPGVTVEDAQSHGGSVRAEDSLGRGASVKRAEAQGDVIATSRMPENSDPKT